MPKVPQPKKKSPAPKKKSPARPRRRAPEAAAPPVPFPAANVTQPATAADPLYVAVPPSELEGAALRYADKAATALGRFAWFLLASRERRRTQATALWADTSAEPPVFDAVHRVVGMVLDHARSEADRRAHERDRVREDAFKREALVAEQAHARAMAELGHAEERLRLAEERRQREVEQERLAEERADARRREAEERAKTSPPT